MHFLPHIRPDSASGPGGGQASRSGEAWEDGGQAGTQQPMGICCCCRRRRAQDGGGHQGAAWHLHDSLRGRVPFQMRKSRLGEELSRACPQRGALLARCCPKAPNFPVATTLSGGCKVCRVLRVAWKWQLSLLEKVWGSRCQRRWSTMSSKASLVRGAHSGTNVARLHMGSGSADGIARTRE